MSFDGLNSEETINIQNLLNNIDKEKRASSIKGKLSSNQLLEPIYLLKGDNTIVPSDRVSDKIYFP